MITKGPTLCHKAPDFSLQKENSDHINAMEDKNHVYSSDNTMERLPSTISEPGVERQVRRNPSLLPLFFLCQICSISPFFPLSPY